MVLPCLWRPGTRQHLELSFSSLLPEERGAFPELIADSGQEDADRSQDWRCDPHCPACHTPDRAPVGYLWCIPLAVARLRTEPPGYGNEHIPDWYCGD